MNIKITKNLLENKTCKNCELNCYCNIKEIKYNTCLKWKEQTCDSEVSWKSLHLNYIEKEIEKYLEKEVNVIANDEIQWD